MPPASPPRYAAEPLPPYAYVPGHGLPHPVNDPRGHSPAAAVKIREGRPPGVGRHARRAAELLAEAGGGIPPASVPALAPDSLAAVQAELAAYRPECWHTSKTPVVRVLAAALVLGAPAAGA